MSGLFEQIAEPDILERIDLDTGAVEVLLDSETRLQNLSKPSTAPLHLPTPAGTNSPRWSICFWRLSTNPTPPALPPTKDGGLAKS